MQQLCGIGVGICILAIIIVATEMENGFMKSMVILGLSFGLIVLTAVGAYTAVRDPINHQVTPISITVYNPVPKQTQGDPLITADGSLIDTTNLQNWVAVSRDLLAKFPYGTKIIIKCLCPFDGQEFEVHDTTHPRLLNTVDVLSTMTVGKWDGVIYRVN